MNQYQKNEIEEKIREAKSLIEMFERGEIQYYQVVRELILFSALNNQDQTIEFLIKISSTLGIYPKIELIEKKGNYGKVENSLPDLTAREFNRSE